MFRINEDLPKRFAMTPEEEDLKDRLIRMLINARHAKYAERLHKFSVFIVPIKDDPTLTACVVPNEAVIYIGEGFTTDKKLFYQLNVVIRHEIAHVLLQHEIRMIRKMGSDFFEKLGKSSFFKCLNIIEDLEISNRKYTSEDKRIIKKLKLNGRLIGGLVTDDIRENWTKLTVEEMYDKLMGELNQLNANLIDARSNTWTRASLGRTLENDYITQQGAQVLAYMDRESPSFIWDPAETFFKKSKFFHKKVSKSFQDKTIELFNTYKAIPIDKVKEDFEKITDSKISDEVALSTGEQVIKPEEKLLTVNVLKYYLGNKAPTPPVIKVVRATHDKDYVAAYNEIIRKLGSSSKCDTDTLLDIFKKVMSEEATTVDDASDKTKEVIK